MAAAFVNPRKILNDYLRLESRMAAADFGCGSGEWALALAKELGDGKVYAIDLLEEPLSALRGKARAANLPNIEIVKADVEKPVSRLLSNSLDVVLMTNLLFQVDDREAVLAQAKRTLKPGGRLLIVEWSEKSGIGPEEKISAQDLRKLARDAGFSPESEFAAGSFHIGMVFQKN